MKISELARATATPVDTIRYYEREGLLPAPARSDSNWRCYGPEHAEQLAFIRQGRGLGLSLQEIKTLLRWREQPCANCGAVNALVDEHIRHIGQRIRELSALKRQLQALRARCAEQRDVAHCGILHGMTEQAQQAATAPPPPQNVHAHTPPS
ncbi:MAG: Cd(II)/Pb(II)-responsive transcriptional regulator [Comamonadaceae bacterium]|nr:Cd(II)/Pb(II)-responsive transcriptional regulator [Comamonadaceae bacterium]